MDTTIQTHGSTSDSIGFGAWIAFVLAIITALFPFVGWMVSTTLAVGLAVTRKPRWMVIAPFAVMVLSTLIYAANGYVPFLNR